MSDVSFERSELIPNFVGTVTFADERVLTIRPFFPLQFQQQWDTESKFGSSENSETDGYYPDYSVQSLETLK